MKEKVTNPEVCDLNDDFDDCVILGEEEEEDNLLPVNESNLITSFILSDGSNAEESEIQSDNLLSVFAVTAETDQSVEAKSQDKDHLICDNPSVLLEVGNADESKTKTDNNFSLADAVEGDEDLAKSILDLILKKMEMEKDCEKERMAKKRKEMECQ